MLRGRWCGTDYPAEFLEVAVPDRLLAKRILDSTGNRVTDPNNGADKNDGESELQSGDHRDS